MKALLTVETPSLAGTVKQCHMDHGSDPSTGEEQEEDDAYVLVLALVEPSLPGQVETESSKETGRRVVYEVEPRSAAKALMRESEDTGADEGGDSEVVERCTPVEEGKSAAAGC